MDESIFEYSNPSLLPTSTPSIPLRCPLLQRILSHTYRISPTIYLSESGSTENFEREPCATLCFLPGLEG